MTKRALLALAALLLSGCAARREVKFSIPVNCILKVEGYNTRCEAISASLAVCREVVIAYACVKAQSGFKTRAGAAEK